MENLLKVSQNIKKSIIFGNKKKGAKTNTKISNLLHDEKYWQWGVPGPANTDSTEAVLQFQHWLNKFAFSKMNAT